MYFVSFSLQKYLHAVDGIDANLQAHPQEPPEVYSNHTRRGSDSTPKVIEENIIKL